MRVPMTYIVPFSEQFWTYQENCISAVSYTHLRAHETKANLVCRLLLEKKISKIFKRVQNEGQVTALRELH